MSQENVDLMREVLGRLHSGGVDAVLPYIDSDFEFSTPPSISLEPETYRGHDGLRRYFDQWADAADRVHIELDEILEGGDDTVVFSGRLAARGRATGIETELPMAGVWHVRDGKAIALEIHPSLDEARGSAGIG